MGETALFVKQNTGKKEKEEEGRKTETHIEHL